MDKGLSLAFMQHMSLASGVLGRGHHNSNPSCRVPGRAATGIHTCIQTLPPEECEEGEAQAELRKDAAALRGVGQ